MANGALLQLVAYGAQDVYLTGNPSITYFKNVYRRHTNFALESVEHPFNQPLDFGSTTTAVVSNRGDLLVGAYIQLELPQLTYADNDTAYLRWTDSIGHYVFDTIDLLLNGQLVDRHYGDWLEIWSQLSLSTGHRDGYHELIGQDPSGPVGLNSGLQRDRGTPHTQASGTTRTLMVPLQFWFCRNVGLALPMIAMPNCTVELRVTTRSLAQLVASFDVSADGPTVATAVPTDVDPLRGTLWVDYAFLDTDERRRFAQVPHEYLVEQVQRNEFHRDTVPLLSSSSTLELNFYHPVKELVWTTQFTAATATGHVQHANYTDRSAINFRNVSNGIYDLDNLGDIRFDISPTEPHASSATSARNVLPALAPTYTAPPEAKNPTQEATLLLEGNERFEVQPGSYFNRMEPYRRHTAVPRSCGINVYTFALRPEEHQPTGTCNFSKLRRAELKLTTRPGVNYTVYDTNDAVVANFAGSGVTHRVYAVNYNVLRVMHGMAGLAYQN